MNAWMSAVLRWFAAAVWLTLALIAPAPAQDQAPAVRVAAGVLPPFVILQGGQLTGFSIDLWNEIASRLKLTSNYQAMTDAGVLMNALRTRNADVIVSGVFYSSERDREFDFSYPIMEAGLQIMVRDEGGATVPAPLREVFDLLFSRSAAIWLAVALLMVVVPAHLLWLLDRGNEDGASPGRGYFPGIFHALTWAISALVSQVQTLPSQWLARILGLLWMFAGVVFIALYTAELTATLTVEQIRGAINGPGDLPGKTVATIRQSTAETYLHEIKADVQEFLTTDEMYQALLDRKVDAVLLGAAALRYYAAHDGAGRVKLVGPEFNRNDVGFVFQIGDPLRRRVSSVLVAMREDGTYQKYYEKWFGSE